MYKRYEFHPSNFGWARRYLIFLRGVHFFEKMSSCVRRYQSKNTKREVLRVDGKAKDFEAQLQHSQNSKKHGPMLLGVCYSEKGLADSQRDKKYNCEACGNVKSL